MALTIAIVGRPNVGKSTLFNRLAGRKLALVDDQPGVTRDRREGLGRLGSLEFHIIDTAGLDDSGVEDYEALMQRQTERAMADADILFFLIDARAGVTPIDLHFSDLLRRGAAKVVLIANKCEGEAGQGGYYDAFSLGLGDPIAISAEHGLGMSELYDVVSPFSDSAGEVEIDEERPIHVAIIGRPNVGKSTLINQLIKQDRLITGPKAGLTRDTTSIDWVYKGQAVRLFDTAGLRRRSRIADRLEKLSVADSLKAVRFADVVILIIDAQSPAGKQDMQLGDLVIREGRALVIAANKWDLVEREKATLEAINEKLSQALSQLGGASAVTISAETGKNINALMPAVMKSYEIWNRRIPTAKLNNWLATMVGRHPPPASSRLRLRYMTQIKTRPPSFALFVNRPSKLPESYSRYLINGLRDKFGLPAVPIRMHLRKGKNPYTD